MKSEGVVIVGNDNVGAIHNLQLDWPHFIGDFEPSPLFANHEHIFASIEKCSKAADYPGLNVRWSRLFTIGLEIRSLENELLFRGSAAPRPKHIGIIYIQQNKISFRVFN